MLGIISCVSKPSSAEIFINDSSTGQFTPFTLQNILPGNYYIKYHKSHYRDDSTLVTVRSSSNSSVYKFLIDTTAWQDYTTLNSGIPSNDLTCIMVDKNNLVYIGSRANGFFSFDGSNWKKIYNSFSYQINCVALDNTNLIYFATPRGFVTYGTTIKEYGFKSSGLLDFRVQAISIDKENNWYIGTQGGMMEVYQPNSPAIDWISYRDQDAGSKYIVASAVDNNDNVWAGMLNSGLASKKTTASYWQYYTVSNSSLQSNNITAIAAAPTGEIWIGYGLDNNFGHGLTCITGSTWNNYNVLPTYCKVASIFIDSKNNKWVATDQGVVMFSDPVSYTLFNYDNTGLNINGASGIAEDLFGNIWVSTNAGLYRYKNTY